MLSPDKVECYLSKKIESSTSAQEDVAEKWNQLLNFYSKKLWHPLTMKLRQLMQDESFKMGQDLKELYDNFIHEFEHRISPLELVEIVMPIARQVAKDGNYSDFLEGIKKTVRNDPEAATRVLIGLAELKLGRKDTTGRCADIHQVRCLIEEITKELDSLPGVSRVHAPFYKVSSTYLREIGDYGAYYREALRYLGCEDAEKLNEEERRMQAVCLGFAALLGEDVYNFGELLAHPILESLKGTGEKWLMDVLLAFNSGDLVKFYQFENIWSEWDDLKKHRPLLEQKIRLLSLMEISLGRPSKNRYITFAEISEKAQIKKEEVEFLVMKALSRGLVKGSIDQINQTVLVTWVQPRVLNSKQITSMAERIKEWRNDVQNAEALVRENAREILTKA